MIVVDVNVLAYRWLPCSLSDLADAVAARDPEWAAPLLWRSEMRNVLAGYLRQGRLTEADALAVLQKAAACLGGREHGVSDAEVVALVRSSGCSAYDCEYAALALRLGVPLVTEDRQLRAAFPGTAVSLREFI
jgi:predicted nucleic acid-binding protein